MSQQENVPSSVLKRRRGIGLDGSCLVIVGGCLLLAGCSRPTVWKAEARSPDGHYIAIAQTIQTGGFGTDSIETGVLLKPTIDSYPPTDVLDFDCQGPVPRPYTLDNKANVGGTIDLTMKWLTPTHLEVTYDGRDGTLTFQAVRYQGIDISLTDVSRNATNSSP